MIPGPEDKPVAPVAMEVEKEDREEKLDVESVELLEEFVLVGELIITPGKPGTT